MLIAVRMLKVRTAAGDTDLEIRLFKPIEERGMWVCRYEIDWPEGSKKNWGAGADGIQALLLALQKIGIELYTSAYHENGELSWGPQGKGYGFPVTKNVRDLLIGDDAKYY